MKSKITKILIGALPFLAACMGESLNNENQAPLYSNNQDSVLSNKTMCFLRLEGAQNQDSTYVYMHIKGDAINGLYNWIPDMKDARRGIINGMKRGDTINVVWNFMQEGIVDTIYTQFLLEEGKLKQQPYITLEDGRQVRDRNAPFKVIYNPTGCPTF